MRYSFDGDVNDVSGNGNDGTTTGNPVYVTGQIGQAIDLYGFHDVVTLPSSIAESSRYRG